MASKIWRPWPCSERHYSSQALARLMPESRLLQDITEYLGKWHLEMSQQMRRLSDSAPIPI